MCNELCNVYKLFVKKVQQFVGLFRRNFQCIESESLYCLEMQDSLFTCGHTPTSQFHGVQLQMDYKHRTIHARDLHESREIEVYYQGIFDNYSRTGSYTP